MLRVWVYRLRDPAEIFNLSKGVFELVPGEYPRPGGRLRVNSDGFAGPDLETSPARRIVALGDSCTIGEGDGRVSYPAMLRARQTVEGTEIVNAGLAGLDAEQLLRRLETAVLPLNPDVVLIFAGWNDLMKRRPLSQGPRTAPGRLSRSLDDLWLTRGLRKLGGFYIRPQIGEPSTGAPGQTGRFDDFEPEAFADSLGRMVDEVVGRGAEAFVLTLPTVLRRDMQPYDLATVGAIFPYFVGGARLGDTMDLIEAYNRTIRRVGAEHGAQIIDLARTFETLPSTRGYFLDTMHPSSQGMNLIAKTVDRAIVRHLPRRPEAGRPR